MFNEGSLNYVMQLGIEVHWPMYMPNDILRRYSHHYKLLKGLEDLGYRRWYVHNNQHCIYESPVTGQRLFNCIEMAYININYV